MVKGLRGGRLYLPSLFSNYYGMKNLLYLLLPVFLCSFKQDATVYRISRGEVSFTSDAPLELIQARSTEIKGLINTSGKAFAFTVPIKSFQGFNSPLQREHFNENYMETNKYPDAVFSGKIIEDIDFSQPGRHTIRAKGILKIHGVEQERILKSILQIEKDKLFIESEFTVLLKEHDITIPKIVHQKIAEEIAVKVRADLIIK